MVETCKIEGHAAIIHTAAASSLGQMLVKICNEDKIDLINIVRRENQVKMLESMEQSISSIHQVQILCGINKSYPKNWRNNCF